MLNKDEYFKLRTMHTAFKSTKEIAKALGISSYMAKHYLKSLGLKPNVAFEPAMPVTNVKVFWG